MTEREKGNERVHPNEVLNQFVTSYVADFLRETGVAEKLEENGFVVVGRKDGRVTRASLDHLALAGILDKQKNVYKLTTPSLTGFNPDVVRRVLKVADMQMETIVNPEVSSVRHLASGNRDAMQLVAYAPNCLLMKSYLPLFNNLVAIEKGEKEYGLGKDVNRSQPENSLGAGSMMAPASKRNAEEFVRRAESSDTSNQAIFEIGSGDASQLVEILLAFRAKGLSLPTVLASDIDSATAITALKLFREKGFENGEFKWRKVDMGNRHELRKAAAALKDKDVTIHIGYILHESRDLALSALRNLSTVFPKATLATSEYYLQDEITQQVPLWFQTIHALSGQKLFRYKELIRTAESFGYRKASEVVHNKLDYKDEPLNSTIFFERKKSGIFA